MNLQIREKTVFKVSFMCLACFGSATRLLKTSSVSSGTRDDSEMFGSWVSSEEIRVENV